MGRLILAKLPPLLLSQVHTAGGGIAHCGCLLVREVLKLCRKEIGNCQGAGVSIYDAGQIAWRQYLDVGLDARLEVEMCGVFGPWQ